MAPLMDQTKTASTNGISATFKPNFVVIGAGARGNAYAQATVDSGLGTIAAVVEPIDYKRKLFGSKYIWGKSGNSQPGQAFADWAEFIEYEQQRRRDEPSRQSSASQAIHGVFVCVRDESHLEVVTALAPLNLHILCEKPLSTTLQSCISIQKTLQQHPQKIFAIGHVLRYSPHNMQLRDLILEDRVIGDVLSVEHTEPVGWWHFSHSYVRGNWRKESFTAPSLLTKSCHDIDWLLWMLCSPSRSQRKRDANSAPHLPSTISSTGTLKQFRKSRKPKEAGAATNCLTCPIQDECIYSAKRIYFDRHLAKGNTGWPVDIVNPEIETLYHEGADGPAKAKTALMTSLAEDYDAARTPVPDIESRPWYGRCVWEADNDVCDDQVVVIEWEDEESNSNEPSNGHGHAPTPRKAKTAIFHMIAQTLAQCERRGRISGTHGEIAYDSKEITIHDFTDDSTRTIVPAQAKNSHHGGGDEGLTTQFVRAVAAVEGGVMAVQEAQVEFLDVTLEEAVRSHAAVFAAEEARRERKVVVWEDWWKENMGGV